MDVLLNLKNPTPGNTNGLDQDAYASQGAFYIDSFKEEGVVDWIETQVTPYPQTLKGDDLIETCGREMTVKSPDEFKLNFHTSYGDFSASCKRDRFPAQVDRVYNLARLGYYSQNYFFRVVNGPRISIVQFGTNGVPSVSNVYNYQSPGFPTAALGECGVVMPQPSVEVIKDPMESNKRGWISMSTSYNNDTGTTWNATAELFINKGDNGAQLDGKLFVPLCSITDDGMNVVDMLPSYGEVQELGGYGVNLGELYHYGNDVIAKNETFDGMGMLYSVTVGDGEGGGGGRG